MATELLLAVDNFNKPKTVSGAHAQAIQLHHSLNGRIDSHITDGVMFMVRRYLFADFANALNSIESDLIRHSEKYLKDSYIQSIQIQVQTDTSLLLAVEVTDQITNKSGTIVFSVEDTKPELLINLIK